MVYYSTIIHQILNLIPRYKFERQVKALDSDRYVKVLTAWRQFVIILYAHISGKKSLRDLVTSINLEYSKFYHRRDILRYKTLNIVIRQ